MIPVGADDDLRLEPLPRGQPHSAVGADFSGLGAEADPALSGRRQQCPLQLGAVNERERRAVAPLKDFRRDRRDQLPVASSSDPTVAPRNLGGVGGGANANLAKGAGTARVRRRAAAVVGCSASTTDAEQIRETVRQFGAALADGRRKQACAALTPSAAADVVRVNAASGFATCAEAVAAAPRARHPIGPAGATRAGGSGHPDTWRPRHRHTSAVPLGDG